MNASDTKPASFGPIEAHERSQLMDALRGFALLGILVVNSWSLSATSGCPRNGKSKPG
jgi:uncharacterized membrane protein YeiB